MLAESRLPAPRRHHLCVDFLDNSVFQRDVTSSVPPRTVFMGSGAISTPVLQALLASPAVRLCGIVTQPDRPAGRRRRLAPTPVADYADSAHCSVIKSPDVNAPEFLAAMADRSPELIVVFSFGQILRSPLLDLPRFGCLNVHTSLLPRHRGASPVVAAILAGDRETGISFMAMDEGLDTGPVYESVRCGLDGSETAGSLESRLGQLAAAHVVRVVRAVCREGAQATCQSAEGVTIARKLSKKMARLRWSRPAAELERRVRAFQPWPKAWFEAPVGRKSKRIQVTGASVVTPPPSPVAPGTVVHAGEEGLVVACGQDCLRIERLIPEGRAEMTAAAFLRGAALPAGALLSMPTDTARSGVHPYKIDTMKGTSPANETTLNQRRKP